MYKAFNQKEATFRNILIGMTDVDGTGAKVRTVSPQIQSCKVVNKSKARNATLLLSVLSVKNWINVVGVEISTVHGQNSACNPTVTSSNFNLCFI